jgi:cation diffusion facilitator family transporter
VNFALATLTCTRRAVKCPIDEDWPRGPNAPAARREEEEAMNALRLPLLLSIAAALLTIALKGVAWRLTGSVSLLSDALESFINLAAASVAYLSLRYSARPADASHTYGHEKIEYFSSGLEGGLILVAAGGIVWLALGRLFGDAKLEPLGPGLIISCVAACINGVVAWILLRTGRKYGSLLLEADGKHLLTDVWTSVGVLAGLGLVALTGWEILDPLIALVVAANILWTAFDLMRRSFDGLMDRALPEAELEKVRQAIRLHVGPNMDYHALRTRQAGTRRFADFHLLVPGETSVREAHALGDRVEEAIRAALPGIEVTVHVEPIEEQSSYQDSVLLAIERRSPECE